MHRMMPAHWKADQAFRQTRRKADQAFRQTLRSLLLGSAAAAIFVTTTYGQINDNIRGAASEANHFIETPKGWVHPKTAWGDPDLTGIWPIAHGLNLVRSCPRAGGPGRGGFGGGPGGGFGGGGGGNGRYNLTFSVNFQNLLNHVNLNNPVGNLGSGLFGQSTATTGGFGGFGGGTAAYNRRIDAQIRFSF